MAHEAGKGDGVRPTDHKAFSENRDKITEWQRPGELDCRLCGSAMVTQPHWTRWYCDACGNQEKKS